MQYFKSMDDIFRMDETGWWEREITPRGIKMSPVPQRGEGSLEYMGETDFFFWTVADYVYHKDYVSSTTLGERYIELGENTGDGERTITHYQTKDRQFPVEPGLNCFVNFNKWTLFSRAPAGLRLNFTSLVIREPFFDEYGITLPADFWERAPQVLNPDVLYIPEASSILRQVSGKLELQPVSLAVYLKAKAMEVAALLIEYVYSRKQAPVYRSGADIQGKIATAQEILAQSMAKPPVVTHLAELVGLNKNALQKGFRHCTGHSVAEYIRAKRMEKALELLREGILPIADVARLSGYQSPANFYKAFSKTFAMRPAEMRMLLQGAQTGGDGPGLAIAREILPAHGGTISAICDGNEAIITANLPQRTHNVSCISSK